MAGAGGRGARCPPPGRGALSVKATAGELADLALALDQQSFVMVVSVVVGRIVEERGETFARTFLAVAVDHAVKGFAAIDAEIADRPV